MEYVHYVLLPQMLSGLAIGMAVVLVALGLSIVFGLLDVINMAHGEFYALGAFLLLVGSWLGFDFWVLCALVPALAFPFGVLVERLLIARVYNRADRHLTTLLLTLGFGLILEETLRLVFGPNPWRIPPPLPGAVEIAGIFVPRFRAVIIGIGAVVVVAVWLLVYRTMFGATLRAVAHDQLMAASLGVPVRIIASCAFGFGVALAAFAGALLAPIYAIFPTMGRDFIFLAFAVVIVGGLGSLEGAVLAGLLLTQIQAVASLYVPPAWTEPIIFVVMIITLLVRPAGLFGRLGGA